MEQEVETRVQPTHRLQLPAPYTLGARRDSHMSYGLNSLKGVI